MPAPFHALAFELSSWGWLQDLAEVRRGLGAGQLRVRTAAAPEAAHLLQRLKRASPPKARWACGTAWKGRPAPRRLAAAVRTRAAMGRQEIYAALNDCHATEKLWALLILPMSAAMSSPARGTSFRLIVRVSLPG